MPCKQVRSLKNQNEKNQLSLSIQKESPVLENVAAREIQWCLYCVPNDALRLHVFFNFLSYDPFGYKLS